MAFQDSAPSPKASWPTLQVCVYAVQGDSCFVSILAAPNGEGQWLKTFPDRRTGIEELLRTGMINADTADEIRSAGKDEWSMSALTICPKLAGSMGYISYSGFKPGDC